MSQSQQPVVEMRDLTMQWGARPVLDRVNLVMQPGERLAVVGPSGAGKSTVLRLLAGLQLPSSGELRLFGKPQTYLRLDQTDPPDVRLVFQNPALLASLTVEQNVGFLLCKKRQLSRLEIRERVEACLEAVGLFDVAHQYPGELSGGMQKRVSFARALIDNPQRGDDAMPLLLYDEPTAGLDPVACTTDRGPDREDHHRGQGVFGGGEPCAQHDRAVSRAGGDGLRGPLPVVGIGGGVPHDGQPLCRAVQDG